jgi:hypothetical protein
VEEGLEVNLLGLTLGIDPGSLSLKLPILGRLGPTPKPERALPNATANP